MKYKPTLTKSLAVFLIAGLLLATLPFSPTATADTASAVNYLKARALDEWGVMALSAAGEASSNVSFLRTSLQGASATAYAKRILAIAALGEDPHTFGQEDFVARLKSFASGGQIGSSGAFNDDIWALTALSAAGEGGASEAQGAKNFILANQDGSGGFTCCSGFSPDADNTAAAIMALVASGMSVQDPSLVRAKNFLQSKHLASGAYADFQGNANTATTAWSESARIALGMSPDSATSSFLFSMQTANGSFKISASTASGDPLTTAYALVALSGKSYPVGASGGGGGDDPPTAQTFSVRLEGRNDTLFEGNVSIGVVSFQTTDGTSWSLPNPRALSAALKAARDRGLSYTVRNTNGLLSGLFLERIGSDQTEGAGGRGWLYLVNHTNPPLTPAAEFNLQTGDEVVWFFGLGNEQPLFLAASSSSIQVGQQVIFSVRDKNNAAVAGANVNTSAGNFTTDGTGQVTVTPTVGGALRAKAEKTGFIRSNAVHVTVSTSGGGGSGGSGGSASLGLSVHVEQAGQLPTVDLRADGSNGPLTILRGQRILLTWSATNATAILSSNFGAAAGNGSLNGSLHVIPLTNTTYTITVQGPGGTATDSVEVRLQTPSASFTVTPSSLDFGNLRPGGSASRNVTLQNGGQSALRISANVTDTDGLFSQNLRLDANARQNFTALLSAGNTKNVETSLSVPSAYTGQGAKQGTLTFTAQPQ